MRRYTTILLATGAIALLASLAFAGYFTSDGWVDPMNGTANWTVFTWEVHYAKDQGQQTPSCYLRIWDGEWLIGSYMMQFTTLDNIVYYTYKRTLPEGTDYAYQFVTFDDATITQFGPNVY